MRALTFITMTFKDARNLTGRFELSLCADSPTQQFDSLNDLAVAFRQQIITELTSTFRAHPQLSAQVRAVLNLQTSQSAALTRQWFAILEN
ncbi:MAG: hypothetical protein ACK5GN_06930 [Pseudomonadota bacterium]